MKKLVLLAVLLALPAMAEQNNIGTCGWGAKLFDGQRGIAPQVLAVTTNGTSGNQTFAISSGTSGCTQDGVVRTSWKTAAYIDSNMNKLARDISRGQGESIDSLASLIGVKSSDSAKFAAALQSNFAQIFPTADASSQSVYDSIKDVLAKDAALASYSVNL